MATPPFGMVLRRTTAPPTGIAPAGPVRDRQAEHRRAVAKATKAAVDAQEPPRKYAMTAWSRGEASDGYVELAKVVPLAIVLKPDSKAVVTDSQRQRQRAAASRWNKARKAAALAAGSGAPMPLPVSTVLDGKLVVRHPRRGELDHVEAAYRTYEVSELLYLVNKIRSKELKFTEMAKLYDDSKHRVPPSVVGKILYPKGKAEAKILALEQKGLPTMGAPRKVRHASSPPTLM